VTVEASIPALIEQSPDRRHRFERQLQDHRPPAGHLYRLLHASGLQHLQTRRHRPVVGSTRPRTVDEKSAALEETSLSPRSPDCGLSEQSARSRCLKAEVLDAAAVRPAATSRNSPRLTLARRHGRRTQLCPAVTGRDQHLSPSTAVAATTAVINFDGMTHELVRRHGGCQQRSWSSHHRRQDGLSTPAGRTRKPRPAAQR